MVMAEEFIKMAKKYRFQGVERVIWTAMPGQLQKALDPTNQLELNFKDNPSDLVVKFRRVPYGANKFLGLSAKSTTGRNKAGIGFKNPGIGSIEKDLHINFDLILKKGVENIRKKFRLSEVASTRRLEIIKNAKVKRAVDEVGDDVLEEIRDKLYDKLHSMRDQQLRIYLIKAWLNASELYPAYFRVTGSGKHEPFSATVEDPRDNNKLEALNTERIKVSKGARHSITVSAGNTKLFNIRAKFDKQKLAGSVVFSADPL